MNATNEHPPLPEAQATVRAGLQNLSRRLQGLTSDQLGQVVDRAHAGRSAVWALRDGKGVLPDDDARSPRIRTVAKVEEALDYLEAEFHSEGQG